MACRSPFLTIGKHGPFGIRWCICGGGVHKKPDARGRAAKFDIALYVMPPKEDTDCTHKFKARDQSVHHDRPARKLMRDYRECQSSIKNEGDGPWVA